MNKLYLGLLISLITCSLTAQTFTEITGTPFNGNYGLIAFADIDNDNDQDVSIGSNLYMNDGSGSFQEVMWNPINGLYMHAIAFADIDNDNDQDLVITYIEHDSWEPMFTYIHTKLYINDGNGIFSEDSSFNDVGHGAGSISFADVDNDTDMDLLITGYTYIYGWYYFYPQTILYLNDGIGGFTESTGNTFAGIGNSSTAFADIDNDNDLDVLIAGYSDSYALITKLYTNDGTGIFNELPATALNGVSVSGSIAFADIDGDADEDLLIAGLDESYEKITKLLTNDGSGNFNVIAGVPFEILSNASIGFADVDNDNDQDVLIGGISDSLGHITKLYTNDGLGNYSEMVETPFENFGASIIAFADIDDDNDQDLLVSGSNNANQKMSKLYANNTITTDITNANDLLKGVSIYPNPSQGQITVDLNELSDVSINVYSLNGSRVYHRENIPGTQYQFELNGEAGIYILEVSTQQETQRYKLVKN